MKVSRFWAQLCVLMAMGMATSATAQTSIGSAVIAENQVEGELAGRVAQIGVGSPVHQDESIRTYADSRAGLKFIDGTTLSISASSEIALDRFVYDPTSQAGDIVFDAVKGAFRFVTGLAEPSSYRVVTDIAAIGIRGTDFDVYALTGGALLLARAGIPFMCPLRFQNDLDPRHEACCELNTDEAGAPLYGIITRRGRRCVGPLEWTGENPGRLLRRYITTERRRDRDGSERSSSPPSSGPPRRSPPPDGPDSDTGGSPGID